MRFAISTLNLIALAVIVAMFIGVATGRRDPLGLLFAVPFALALLSAHISPAPELRAFASLANALLALGCLFVLVAGFRRLAVIQSPNWVGLALFVSVAIALPLANMWLLAKTRAAPRKDDV